METRPCRSLQLLGELTYPKGSHPICDLIESTFSGGKEAPPLFEHHSDIANNLTLVTAITTGNRDVERCRRHPSRNGLYPQAEENTGLLVPFLSRWAVSNDAHVARKRKTRWPVASSTPQRWAWLLLAVMTALHRSSLVSDLVFSGHSPGYKRNRGVEIDPSVHNDTTGHNLRVENAARPSLGLYERCCQSCALHFFLIRIAGSTTPATSSCMCKTLLFLKTKSPGAYMLLSHRGAPRNNSGEQHQ